MNDYQDVITFPNGLVVEMEMTDQQYQNELKLCSNQVELDAHLKRWGDLFPELKNIKPQFEIVKQAIGNVVYQNQLLLSANAFDVIYTILPTTFLKYYMMAKKYQVPMGVVIIQLYNVELEQKENTQKLENIDKGANQ